MRVVIVLSVGACIVLASCGKKAETVADTGPVGIQGPIEAASLPAPYNTADLENGKTKFAMCSSCHTITEGGANLTGPNLHGVFARRAGTLEKFKYSDAVKKAGFVWDPEKLDHWLAKPKDYLPGTKMTFAGFKNPKDRIDVIGYIAEKSSH